MNSLRFKNREEAALELSKKLTGHKGRADTIVFGLARGGVILAAVLGERLKLPFHSFIVRKIGHPENPEFAIGAMAEGGTILLNKSVIRSHGLSDSAVTRVIQRERKDMERRLTLYRKNKPLPSLKGKTVILTDDGAATGSTMEAAIRDLRESGARKIILAIPVSSTDAYERLSRKADEVVCLSAPDDFYAVGQFYDDFPQVTDAEVLNTNQT